MTGKHNDSDAMMNNNIAHKILNIGPEYKVPRGGIAQVLHNYDKYIYSDMLAVVNSCDGSLPKKIFCLVAALFKCMFLFVSNKNIKIVHIHTASYKSFRRSSWFASIAHLFNKRVFMHIHGGAFVDYREHNRKFVDKKLLSYDTILVLDNKWKVYFEKEISHNRVVVMENVIDPPQKLHIPVSTDDQRMHLLFLGLICDKKGIFDLVDALIPVKDELNGKIMLHIAGNGETERLKQVLADNHLENIVTFEGWVSGEKKLQLMNSCDVYILPSYIEGMSISILEAMSYGMAIISTRVGGTPSIVHEGANGILFEPADKSAMIQAIRHFVDNKDDIAAYGAESLRLVAPYLPNNVANHLEALYADCIDRINENN
ncbi:MAG: glycosyltransferase family 4 protein [Bacteroidales bacterium]|nr:glycosyltransferase family 4 protein [Candidatus Sodaliphilus aphodohippi]